MTDLAIGIVAFEEKNYSVALHLLTPLAQQGNDQAQCILGCMYQLGLGMEPDQTLAAFWYRQAVEQGNGLAANNLAGLVLAGYKGMALNPVEADQCYESARLKEFPHTPNG